MYLDVDIHHGADWVQSAFYSTDQVLLTISLHRHTPGFFPSQSGSNCEKGKHGTPGVGYNLNMTAVFWIWFWADFGANFKCQFWSVMKWNRLKIGLFRQRNRKTILFNKSNPLAIRCYITYELSNYRNPYILPHTIHSSSSYILGLEACGEEMDQ